MKIKILAIGDIVGRPGRDIIKQKLPELIQTHRIDFTVVNAENVAGGSGVTPETLNELLSYGINALTSGDHIWKRKEIIPELTRTDRLIRPANYPAEAAGKGYTILETANRSPIAVVNLVGRTFMPSPANCPFHAIDQILTELSTRTKVIVVDAHMEATSEKIALGWYLDGRVSFVFGTHTHIQTADECILPRGTAYITDVGMTGPYDSVLGRKKEQVLAAFTTGMPNRFEVATDNIRLGGAIVTIDTETGHATSIERVMLRLKD